MNLRHVTPLLAALLVACNAAPQTTGAPSVPSEPKRSANQTIKIAQTAIHASLNPESSNSYNSFYGTIYDTLTGFGNGYEIVPQAAEKWEFSPSGWKFTLRNNITFTDGSPLTADDVVFTITNIVEKNLPQRTYVPSIASARAIDKFTVEVLTKTPDATLLNGIPWVFILPKAYYEKVGKDEFSTKPMGSGPYEVVEFRPSDRAVFRKKASHPFRTVQATELQFQAIPEHSSVLNGLRTGDIDMTMSVDFTGDQIEQVKASGMTILSIPTSSIQVVSPQYENEQRGNPLKEKKVREALNYAVDKNAISQSIYKGQSKPAGQLTHPASPFWIPDVQPYPYDPAKAKQLLAEAGYPNGFTLQIGISFSPANANTQLVLAVQSYFRDVGVIVPANSLEQAAYLDRFRGTNGQVRPDMVFLGSSDAAGTGASWRGAVNCDVAPTARWWCNQEFNRLFDEASGIPDVTKRTEVLRQAHRALLADVPFVFLLINPIYVTHNEKIQGVTFTTPVVTRLDSIYRVD